MPRGKKASLSEKSDWVELFDRESIDGHISGNTATISLDRIVDHVNRVSATRRQVNGGEAIVVNYKGYGPRMGDFRIIAEYGINNVRFLQSFATEKDVAYTRIYLADLNGNPYPGTMHEFSKAELSDEKLFREAVDMHRYPGEWYIVIDINGNPLDRRRFYLEENAIEWASGFGESAVALLKDGLKDLSLIWAVPGFTGTRNQKPMASRNLSWQKSRRRPKGYDSLFGGR